MAQIQDGMQEKNLRKQLAATVTNIQWSYAIFWSASGGEQGVLTWGDGYYNGDIKTRKTTQSMDFKADQTGLHRSEQLRELYESLLADESNQQTRRPSASLSPEDLTASEWYYLVCMSFTFSPGQGLPGRALESNQCTWVSNAQFADSKTFSRSLLAKSASIQTVVCFPFMDGVLELGTTEMVLEDHGLIQQITTAFWDLPFPICSEQSMSNCPLEGKDEEENMPPLLGQRIDVMENRDLMSEHHLPLELILSPFSFNFPSYAPDEETELTRDKIEELHPNIDELQNGSPNYSSNDSFKMDDCMSFENTPMIPSSPEGGRIKSNVLDYLQEGNFAKLNSLLLDSDETHYQRTLSSILKNSKGMDSTLFLHGSRASSFTIWRRNMNSVKPVGNRHQRMLKKILIDMSWIPLQPQEENGIRNKVLKQDGDDAGANHVLSERRRREKLNEKFVILRSLVPSVSKADKASILADTIEYLKELERRVEELESNKERIEFNTRDKRKHPDVSERTSDNYNYNDTANKRKPSASKRKARATNEYDDRDDHPIISKSNAVNINVSVIEKEVMLEMNCTWRDSLLIETVNAISNLQLDAFSVQSSTVDGILTLVLKAKSRSLAVVTPGMVKRALQRVVGKC
uniref:Basic helix-loop-helix n=2 Tax=Narcissus tazetta subsp. chinensis TaxID=391288 RepID=A0A517FM44_NARTA|nr:basic helix-loop-helix [Narcissus tazetta subsp. chinensis]